MRSEELTIGRMTLMQATIDRVETAEDHGEEGDWMVLHLTFAGGDPGRLYVDAPTLYRDHAS